MNNELLHSKFRWNGVAFSDAFELISFVDGRFPELKDFIREWFGTRGVVYAMTSGSTGEPKKIRLDRQHMINSALATGRYFNLESGSRVLLCLPLTYIAGRMMLVRSMVLGWHLDSIQTNSKPDIPLDIVYDFSAMVPMQLYNSWRSLKNIKTIIVGGGEVHDRLLDIVKDLPTRIYATYGMTETITHVGIMPLNRISGRTDGANYFEAMPNVSFSIDQRQCLIIKAAKISFRETRTNDVVELLSNQKFRWIARYDHVVNSGGVKLLPELIENKLRSLINHRFFIDSIPDKLLGEKLVLLIESEDKYDLMNELNKYQTLNPTSISRIEIPKKVYFLKDFVETETGKINRNKTMEKVYSLGDYRSEE